MTHFTGEKTLLTLVFLIDDTNEKRLRYDYV